MQKLMTLENHGLVAMTQALKRIAFVVTRSDLVGGAHVHVRDFATELHRRGVDVRVYAGGRGAFAEELAERGIAYEPLRYLVHPIRPWSDMKAYAEIRNALVRFEPQLVSTHSSKAGWLGRLAARSLGIPTLFTAHGWAFTEGVPWVQRRIYALAERMAALFTDRIITVSEYDRRIAESEGVARGDKLLAVHNGMPDIDSSEHAEPGRSSPKIVMVARFAQQKDHGLLLRALARNVDCPWSLELVGDGPLRGQTESEVARLGLSSRVKFLGTRADVAARLAGAQIFVLTSRWEGLPRSIIEAMRAGLPVIASDVGGVSEAVEDGKTGFVVPLRDEEALARRLRGLIENDGLRTTMGHEARLRYVERFQFSRMFATTFRVYESMLREPVK